VGANGTVYFGYIGSDGQPAVSVSRDKGKTWSNNQHVGTQFGINNSVFPAMVAGDDNRASLAFIGTPTEGNYQDTANFKGVWHLYVATTYDGGKTWVTSDATPSDPVQRGSICTGGTTCGNDRNLLDFIDATIDKTGHVEVAYADGCINACVTNSSHTSGAGPADAQAAYASIARQSSGRTLFASQDAKPDLSLTSQQVVRSGNNWAATLVVKNTGPSKVTGFVTRITDNGKIVGRTTGSTLAKGASLTLHYSWAATTGKHTFIGTVDPANLIAESSETNNKRVNTGVR
jgi:hypothetical protein